MDSSSPARESGSPCPEVLTPRSKIARMLADIDNGPTPSPESKQTSGFSRVADTRIGNNDHGLPGDELTQEVNIRSDLEDDEDSDDSVRQPAGLAARRMLKQRNADRTTGQARSPPVPSSKGLHVDDEDLYSATPMRVSLKHRARSPVASEDGLFVSPAKSSDGNGEDRENDNDDEEGLSGNPFGSRAKLAKLVAQKRKERLEREESERQKRADITSNIQDEGEVEHEQDTDPEIERIMSDAARPTRKASKRALLEMERETQRIARQQALAHQMKVKKKFTTSDLLARFEIRQTSSNNAPPLQLSCSSAQNSDGPEMREPVSTPPSSPPTPFDRQKALVEQGALSRLVPVREDSLASLNAMVARDEELPDIAEILRSSQSMSNRATRVEVRGPVCRRETGQGVTRQATSTKREHNSDNESDDDLDIIDRHPKHLKHFRHSQVAAKSTKQSKALHALRQLSRIGAYDEIPRRKGVQPSKSRAVLELQLRRRAKEQACQEQLERIAELKAKGIEIQTTEEREREAEAFESLLEKARNDAESLRKAEKAAKRLANGEVGIHASEDESEDDDYVASGSENEELVDDDEQDEDGLVDVLAEAASVNEPNDQDEDVEVPTTFEKRLTMSSPVSSGASAAGPRIPRNSKRTRVIMDDDDDEDEERVEPQRPTSVSVDTETDPFAAFGFAADSALMSPTQAFNATMCTPTQDTQENSFDVLRRIAPPSILSLPPTFPFQELETQRSVVQGSQVPESQRINLDWQTQPPEPEPPETPLHTLSRGLSGLIETPGWEPTQDAGLPTPIAAALKRIKSHEPASDSGTQSTILMRVSESPVPSTAPRRGRFSRRQAALESSDEEQEFVSREQSGHAVLGPKRIDAFHEMARKRKEALTDAERTEAQKEMKAMMDEQAEESEDEYTGLGGDDYIAPENEEDKAMIDEGPVDVDVRQLAAAYAERQRVADEAATTKLYKDLTTGALRRKQANMFELDEDEDEVAMRRRQMRQREEARKRKILLQDDNIASLVEGKPNKGKDAFLKAIADDDRDDDFIDYSEDEEGHAVTTQEETQTSTDRAAASSNARVLRETSGNKRRWTDEDEHAQDRPPAKQRRTEASALRRPASLLEIKESVSFLLEEPDIALFGPSMLEDGSGSDHVNEFSAGEHDDASGDDDLDTEQARQNDGGFAPNSSLFDSKIMPPPHLPATQRRTMPAIVDRLSLKRNASSSSDGSTGSRSAWAASGPGAGVFRTPSLLRRATSAASANDGGVTTLSRENSAGSTGSGVKMGGSKKSSLAYQARAEEHRAIVEAGKRQREENTKRIAGLRRQQSGGILGGSLRGRFE
nr:mediator of replication checkpoint protein 1 [Quercus suber]